MTAIDDLKVGMWIAVTKLHHEQCESFWGHRPVAYGGEPLRVLAVSLPFICVHDGEKAISLDCRIIEVQKLTPKYVRAMRLIQQAPPQRAKRKRRKRDPMLCPRCRCGRLIQRATTQSGEVVWDLYCTQCGYSQQYVTA